MSGEAWLTLAVLAVMFAAMITERASPVVAVVSATATLFIVDVIDAGQAFAGLGNPAPLTVAALYIIAGGVDKTNALQPILERVLPRRGGARRSIVQVTAPSAGLSAFLANTPIIAMLIPAVQRWAQRRSIPVSKVLIPLSYATILGGCLTAIGTSTNLVVSGLVENAGDDPLQLFAFAKIGLPVAAVGLLAIWILAPILMPERRAPTPVTGDEARQFVIAMEVEPGGPLIGSTIEQADLRHLEGVFLVEVERGEETFAPVRPSLVLEGGDRLTFVGNAELVVDLQRRRGLRLADVEGFDDPSHRHHTFVEAVIGPSSKLVNSTLRQADFRARYQAAVVAIHRSGQRVTGKLGSVRLRPGDTLLLLAGEDFPTRWRNREDFLLVAHLGGTAPAATRYAPIAIAVLVGLIAVPALGLLSLFKTALLGAGALVVTGVLRPREARDAIDLNVVILIGAAFGLGAALESTGLAARLADLVQDAMSWAGRPGSVLGVVVVTMVLTELITNAGAVVLAYPIAVAVAAEIGVDPRLAALAVAAAGSASFITPVGYQTNTMVYGPGGYRFTDYARLGLPLSVLVAATITVAVLAWS